MNTYFEDAIDPCRDDHNSNFLKNISESELKRLVNKSQSRVKQLEKIQLEAKKLFEHKNKDYGDAFANYGTVGVLVRMGDKIARLQTISKNSVTFVNDEKMRDTLIDLHNYAAMAIMCLDND